MKVAVIGCGAMGARHAAVVGASGDELVAVVDVHGDRAAALGAQLGCPGLTEVPEGVDAVVVATPARSHRKVVDRELSVGRWVLCEKPLVVPGDRIASSTARLAPAMSERFHPAWDAVNPTELTGITLVRSHPGSDRGEDVDVALDLMIHDLDRVLSWGGPVRSLRVEAPGWPHRAQVRLEVGGREVLLIADRRGELRKVVFTEASHGADTLRDTFSLGPDSRCLSRQWAAFQRFVGGEAFPVSVAFALRTVELAGEIGRLADPS